VDGDSILPGSDEQQNALGLKGSRGRVQMEGISKARRHNFVSEPQCVQPGGDERPQGISYLSVLLRILGIERSA